MRIVHLGIPACSLVCALVHRIAVDILWLVAGVYVAAVILREIDVLAADTFPSVSRAIEFAIGTGGHGAGTGA